MRVVQIGNFRPPHSTENHLLIAMRAHGWDVFPFQEDEFETFNQLGFAGHTTLKELHPDFILWTRTGWDWRTFPGGELRVNGAQHMMLRCADRLGIPVVGYHLDIWWGLERQVEVTTEPFFSVDLLITADGDPHHQDAFERAGINHAWLPPAVSANECALGTPRDEFRSRIAFVGSWQGHYHAESKHRHDLVAWLRRNHKRDCKFWPQPGQDAIRGEALRDLYASVDVVVGDSCFSGTGLANYWSDRIPETLGRGGFLLHPYVEGLHDQHPYLTCWKAFDWDGLGETIENLLKFSEERKELAMLNRNHTMENHTYEHRMLQLVDLLQGEHLL